MMDNLGAQASQNDYRRKNRISGCWDEWSAYYDYNRFHDRELILKEDAAWKGFFARELGGKRLKILDVGTGTGFLSIPLAELGHDVVGIDMSEGMMSLCRSKSQERNLEIDLRKGDAEALPFNDESFDIVVSRWVLWTLLHPERAVAEWHRVLKPGGRAYAFDTPFIGEGRDRLNRRIKRNVARFIIAVLERRNAWSERYDKEIDDHLPLNYSKLGSFEKQVRIFADCGFKKVMEFRMDEASKVSKEKWSKMPWRYRLLEEGNEEWHFIRGCKD
jgi:ubiquinone/menaquinone biosynthesis C-methylase UbiE